MHEDGLEGAPDPLLGQSIADRYRVLSIIGEGGMGRVYLAEQKMGQAKRQVAIKTLHPSQVADAHVVERFHRESSTVIQLKHPNTIQFYDFGELPDGTLYIVMEHIDGASLAAVLLQDGAMDFERIKRIVIQVCGSLHEAHGLGIIHRDLKPDNILLTNRAGHHDFVKVLDFGIAKRSEAERKSQATLTRQGMILGTPPYMSPEQFSGKALDARSDIYSLALIVYEMLTGALPFDAVTPWEWASHHLTAQPRDIGELPAGSGLTASARQCIMRSLKKNPDERPSDVLVFMHELTGIDARTSGWAPIMAENSARLSSASGSHAKYKTPSAASHAQQASSGVMRKSDMHAPSSIEVDASAFNTSELAEQTFGHKKTGNNFRTMLGTGALIAALSAGGIVYWYKGNQANEAEALEQTRERAKQALEASLEESKSTQPTPTPTTNEANPKTPEVAGKTAGKEVSKPARGAGKEANEGARSKADPATSRAMAEIERSIKANDFQRAAQSLKTAEASLGPKHPALSSLRNTLSVRGGNAVGILMQQGRCAQAQGLYRVLASVGASAAAKRQFSEDWCPRP